MKKIFIISTIILALLSACSVSKKKPDESSATDMKTITGVFESKQGVMLEIGCYCYKVGYLTTENTFPVVVCFDELKNVESIYCDGKLTVSGYYKTIKINQLENSPCPAGEKEVFMVTSYNCE